MATARYNPGSGPNPIGPIFPLDSQTRNLFAGNFDHHPFLFHHSLHSLDIFKMPALLKLADRCMRKRQHKTHYETGEPPINGYFGNKPKEMTLVQALDRIEEGKNWIILKRIHEEPEYKEVLHALISELSGLTGTSLRREYKDPILTVFIASPYRVTPYHLDGEANFLTQISGAEAIFLYDSNDRAILSMEEKERYWTGHLPVPKWNDELWEGHWHHHVSEGEGVFIPATFPYWIKNFNCISISVSINFKRARNDEIGVYRTNYYARKLGMHPQAPGISPILDRAKSLTFGKLYEAARGTRRFLRSHLTHK